MSVVKQPRTKPKNDKSNSEKGSGCGSSQQIRCCSALYPKQPSAAVLMTQSSDVGIFFFRFFRLYEEKTAVCEASWWPIHNIVAVDPPAVAVIALAC